MALHRANVALGLTLAVTAETWGCSPAQDAPTHAPVVDIGSAQGDAGWVAEPDPTDELDAGTLASSATEYCEKDAQIAVRQTVRVQAGTKSKTPLGMLPPGCYTIVAVGPKLTGLQLRLLLSFPGPDAGLSTTPGMPPMPFPELVVAQGSNIPGQDVTLLGKPPHCFRNPIPVPVPLILELSAQSGVGEVQVLLCSAP